MITWAVGQLVGLADARRVRPELKKWRFADLPILPDAFRLVPNDERSRKQLNAIHRLMQEPTRSSDLNACDAGREGELIFAYICETARSRSRSSGCGSPR